MTSGLMTSSDKKFKLLAISKFSNDPKDYAEYKRYLNYFTNLKKKLRLDYYREKAELYGHDRAKMWRLVNEISNRKRKNPNFIKCLCNENGEKLKIP